LTRTIGGKPINRDIHIYHGDFNSKIDEILGYGEISEKEATFCLLDQRTFECDWQTVEKLARYKKSGNKIELFEAVLYRTAAAGADWARYL
jgi:hypothetical protein